MELVLCHVRDVEEGAVCACEVVGLQVCEGGVADGHAVGGEGDHFCVVGAMQVVEGGFEKIIRRGRSGGMSAGGIEGR